MSEYEFKETIECLHAADVLVIGGGPSGIAAAVSAARLGKKVLLADNNGYLGGMATAGLVGPFMTCYDSDQKRPVIKGIYEELVVRMEKKGLAIHPSKCPPGSNWSSYITRGHHNVGPFDSEGLKVETEALCEESGVELLYYVTFVKAAMKGRNIEGLIFASKAKFFMIKADLYIDCTGDGDVAFSSGVTMAMGREGDGHIQPGTLFFEISGVNRDEVAESKKNDPGDFWCYREQVAKAREEGYKLPKEKFNFYECPTPGHWKVNTTRIHNIDVYDPFCMTKASIEGRKQVQVLMKFMHEHVDPCKNAKLEVSASRIGIRESRRIVGEYVLTAEDAMKAKKFDDGIALCGYAMDIHSPDGGMAGQFISISGGAYAIPYRCLIPREVDNLLAAGRCISANHEVLASLRVMPPCFATGEAAGAAAALALSEKTAPRSVDVKKLRDQLIKQGAVLE